MFSECVWMMHFLFLSFASQSWKAAHWRPSVVLLFFCHHNCLIHPLFIIDFRNSTVLHCQRPYWAILLGKILIVPQKTQREQIVSVTSREKCTAHIGKLACIHLVTWICITHRHTHKKAKHLVQRYQSDGIYFTMKILTCGLRGSNVKLKEKADLFSLSLQIKKRQQLWSTSVNSK